MLRKFLQATRNYFCQRQKKTNFLMPVEFEKRDIKIFDYVINNQLTMVSEERLIATIQACKYAILNEIPGDFVECGVWRGGNSIAAKLLFEAYGSNKKVILMDTFAGMTEPTELDETTRHKTPAKMRFQKEQKESHNGWCYASLEEVKENFTKASAGPVGVEYIVGDITETLLTTKGLPSEISILRLDTDWYESTKFEMEVLYPLLSSGGVLIVDDYGHWNGARKAIDEYFDNNPAKRPLLQYTDYTGRMGIKK